jgi:hypothetical protein
MNADTEYNRILKNLESLRRLEKQWLDMGLHDERPVFSFEWIRNQIEEQETILESIGKK